MFIPWSKGSTIKPTTIVVSTRQKLRTPTNRIFFSPGWSMWKVKTQLKIGGIQLKPHKSTKIYHFLLRANQQKYEQHLQGLVINMLSLDRSSAMNQYLAKLQIEGTTLARPQGICWFDQKPNWWTGAEWRFDPMSMWLKKLKNRFGAQQLPYYQLLSYIRVEHFKIVDMNASIWTVNLPGW